MHQDAMEKAKRLAQTQEGQQLIALLQQMGGKDLEQAVDAAATGNYSQIQQTLSLLMQNPEARKLLEKMEW